MKSVSTILVLMILLIVTLPGYGKDTFRPIDPNNPGNRYGKAPDAGSAFLYFTSTSQQYYISHADYNGFEAAVEAAFESWNTVGPVQFSESTSSGVQVTGVFDTFEGDRKSTRLNSSHVAISYAVFCLKKNMRLVQFG